jgi:hypothetical protein
LNVDAVAQLRVAAAEMAVKQSADLKPLACTFLIFWGFFFFNVLNELSGCLLQPN